MDKELFKKTEGQLYRYYRYKKQINRMIRKTEILENQIQSVDNQIRNVHKYINIDPYQSGQGIQERVQSSIDGSSYMEKEMEGEVTKLEKEKCNRIKAKLKEEYKIRDRQWFIRIMDTNIEMLSEEDKRFIELKYGDEKEVPYIAMQLNMAQATAYRHREELVENIADFMEWIK